ncbi:MULTISPECIES: FliH/SctL family protein [Comamonas]|jgi:flagellar assembly protein FliH|uniref:FliH/SctL family protein n=1 Tax=Comamonas TaxID=283 RepID=UPI0028504C0B|nr:MULTISPECIES: FliH/SctL family protein [Comamonas]MDR3065334.1 flagellar assembly protein FliH [Comamonas sp.]MEB5966763.1 flagellar assembly protein FliH [Comamonas testosteroni]
MSKGQTPRSHSRFIPQEEIDDSTVVQWHFGAVDAKGSGVFAPAQPAAFIPAGTTHFNGFSPSIAHQPQPQPEMQAVEPVEPAVPAFDEEQLQQMLEQARAEGHAQGLAEGRAQTQQQWQQHLDDHINGAGRESAQRVDGVLQGLEDSFKQLQSGMAQELLNLACDIARQVVRQELRSQPQALLPVIRQALDMLVEESRPVTVRLNPADFELLDEALRAEHGAHSRIQWLGDASIESGDVKVESGGAEVDGSLDKRWRRAVAALGLVSTWYDGDKA